MMPITIHLEGDLGAIQDFLGDTLSKIGARTFDDPVMIAGRPFHLRGYTIEYGVNTTVDLTEFVV